MSKLMFTLLLVIASVEVSYCQSDWQHPKVYQRNIINKLIDKEGRPIFKHTNNTMLRRATFYEFFNNQLYATTNYYLNENGRTIQIVYRCSLVNNQFTQIVEMPSSPSPTYSSFTLQEQHKAEITDHGLVYYIYRNGGFIDLIKIESIRGQIVMKN